MERLPFTVSARTARLIGRENVASARGAIIELVKNSYDADSKKCLIIFDIPLTNETKILSCEKWNIVLTRVEQTGLSKEELNSYFEVNFNVAKKRANLTAQQDLDYNNFCKKLSSIYIIDNGEGMSSDVVKDHWMVIGTQNKLINFKSNIKDRIKSGAKGIGRFALDRLGEQCEMISFTKKKHLQAIKWTVNWNEFDGEGKKIEDVSAILENINDSNYFECLLQHYPALSKRSLENLSEMSTGTCLRITQLRDDWFSKDITNLFNDLVILTPPLGNEEFSIIFEHIQQPHEYGKVLSSICDDFDYKLRADVNVDGKLNLHIIRREYDVNKIPDDFFERGKMKKFPYRRSEFSDKGFALTKSIFTLLPGMPHEQIAKLGPFSLTLYYLKRSVRPKDISLYFYRNINYQSGQRQQWLETFKGIKIFRDNFRVRPYGDPRESAFDWLSLGPRKAKSPAGVGRNLGGYRMEVNNLSGVIEISRLLNPCFEDKSSREGLQEGDAFNLFKMLIIEIIAELEKDRSTIVKELKSYSKEQSKINIPEEIKTGERLVEELTNSETLLDPQDLDPKVIAMAKYARQQRDKVLELERTIREEQSLLRAMASNGLVMATFGHDFSQQLAIQETRMLRLKKTLERHLKEEDLLQKGCQDSLNPFRMIEDYKDDDRKIAAWIDFAKRVARKDKRNRKQISLKNYFLKLQKNWEPFLSVKGIALSCDTPENVFIQSLEIDLVSIFNNLIINSIDAFSLSTNKREIFIKCTIEDNPKVIKFTYRDNGPGLSLDLNPPEIIFDPLITTKRDVKTGEPIGTGLGMWIVKTIIHNYGGEISLNRNLKGFCMYFTMLY